MMKKPDIKIRKYNNKTDKNEVIGLWKNIFPAESPHNEPALSIEKKIENKDGLFFVAATTRQKIIGTIMGGYDGHRGWIYSVAVSPEYRKEKIGSLLLKKVENKLIKLGCLKINLQIVESNKEVVNFYSKNGYNIEERISLGKKLY